MNAERGFTVGDNVALGIIIDVSADANVGDNICFGVIFDSEEGACAGDKVLFAIVIDSVLVLGAAVEFDVGAAVGAKVFLEFERICSRMN